MTQARSRQKIWHKMKKRKTMPVCSPDIRARDLTIPDLRACRHADPKFCGAANREQMKFDRVVRFMNATLLELECVRGQRRPLATRPL